MPRSAFQRLRPDESIDDTDIERGLTWLVRNGIGAQGMETLAAGTLLAAFALQLGASYLTIGILAAVPHLAQFAQVPAVLLVEKLRARRMIAVIAGGASRPALLLMGAAALVPSPDMAIAMLVIGFVWRYGLGAVVGCGWNSWIRDLVPQERMGAYFGRRLVWMTLYGLVLGLLAGFFVDTWKVHADWSPKYAYALLYVGAFLCGAYSVYCMIRMPEPRMAAATASGPMHRRLLMPLRDRNFRRLLIFLGSWNFAVNLAAPFFTVHMLTRLHLDLTTVVILTSLSQIANMLVLRQWGAIADRFASKSVLQVCAPLFLLCIFAWTFTTFPDRHAGTIPLLIAIHILAGIATAGVTLASSTIALKLAPKGDATAYLATNSLVNALAAGIAPILGGFFAHFFAVRELTLALHWRSPTAEIDVSTLSLKHWDFFFIMAALIGLYSLHRLGRVREEGEVGERVVVSDFLLWARRAMRNVSTVAGLRGATEFPIDTMMDKQDDTANPPPDVQEPAESEASEQGDKKD